MSHLPPPPASKGTGPTPTPTQHALNQVLSVLVVDDEPIIRRIVGDHLRKSGFEVVQVGSGQEALNALAVRKFHLMITDLEMPGMNGLQLMEHVTKEDPLIRCILLTGSTSLETALSSLKLGAVAFLTKPLELHELDTVVNLAVAGLRNWMRQLTYLARLKRRSS